MNTHRTPIIQLSKAIGGYLLAAEARNLSVNTLRDYTTTFKRFQDFLGEDLPISKITPRDIEGFLSSITVSKKTVLIIILGYLLFGPGQ